MNKIKINGTEIDTSGMSQESIDTLKQVSANVENLHSSFNKVTTELDNLKKTTPPAPNGGFDMDQLNKMMETSIEKILDSKLAGVNKQFQSFENNSKEQHKQGIYNDFKQRHGEKAFNVIKPQLDNMFKAAEDKKMDLTSAKYEHFRHDILGIAGNSEDKTFKMVASKIMFNENITDEDFVALTEKIDQKNIEAAKASTIGNNGGNPQAGKEEKTFDPAKDDAKAAVLAEYEKK